MEVDRCAVRRNLARRERTLAAAWVTSCPGSVHGDGVGSRHMAASESQRFGKNRSARLGPFQGTESAFRGDGIGRRSSGVRVGGGARAPDVRRSRAACPAASTEAAVAPDAVAVAGARCVLRRAARSLPSARCRVLSTESSEEGAPLPGFPTSCMDSSGVYAAPGMGSRTARAAGELGKGSAAASSSQRCVLKDSGGLVSMSALRCSSHGRACPPPRLFFLPDSTKGCISSSIQQRQRFSEG
jgi:hypothetical protein